MKARLRALLAASTPGEWFTHYEVVLCKAGEDFPAICDAVGEPNGQANVNLIAEAHNALPALLSALDAADSMASDLHDLQVRYDELFAEAEEFKADADRYRQIRQNWIYDDDDFVWDGLNEEAELDAAIDAAIAARESSAPKERP